MVIFARNCRNVWLSERTHYSGSLRLLQSKCWTHYLSRAGYLEALATLNAVQSPLTDLLHQPASSACPCAAGTSWAELVNAGALGGPSLRSLSELTAGVLSLWHRTFFGQLWAACSIRFASVPHHLLIIHPSAKRTIQPIDPLPCFFVFEVVNNAPVTHCYDFLARSTHAIKCNLDFKIFCCFFKSLFSISIVFFQFDFWEETCAFIKSKALSTPILNSLLAGLTAGKKGKWIYFLPKFYCRKSHLSLLRTWKVKLVLSCCLVKQT